MALEQQVVCQQSHKGENAATVWYVNKRNEYNNPIMSSQN